MVNTSPYDQPQSGAPGWAPGERETAVAFLSLTIYLSLDINVGIYRIFRKKQGLYYWSLVFATWGVAIVAIGNIFKNLKPNWGVIWPLWTILINGGWSVYAPAELLILYSRLHLVNQNSRLHRWLLIMILVGSTLVIIPNWVFTFPAYNVNPKVSSIWSPRMAIMNRTSQACFTTMEFVLSGIYIHSLLGILRGKIDISTRRVMRDLIGVNVTVIVMDIAVIILIWLNKVSVAYPLQDFTYAFKYKIEFVVLNQLMAIATRGCRRGERKRSTFEERRYRQPGRTFVLTGYSDDNISGLRLPFPTGYRPDWPDPPSPNAPKMQGPSSQEWVDDGSSNISNLAKPQPSLSRDFSNHSSATSNDRTMTEDVDEKAGKSYDIENYTFAPSPSFDLYPSPPSSQQGQTPFSFPGQESGDTLLAPVADDNENAYIPNALPPSHPKRQRNSLRQILFRRNTGKPKEEPEEPKIESKVVRNSDTRTTNPTFVPIPNDENQQKQCESDSDDEGIHAWERRGKRIRKVPWFEREESGDSTEDSGVGKKEDEGKSK